MARLGYKRGGGGYDSGFGIRRGKGQGRRVFMEDRTSVSSGSGPR